MATAVDDRELVAAALGGDRQAFAALIERHEPRVRALARRLLAHPFDAEDVTQEALLQAYLRLAELRDPDRFGSWVAGIAHNLARMRLRQRRCPVERNDPGGPAPPEQALEAAELARLVQDALDELPRGEREAVLMHYVAGLSCSEIAARLGLSSGAVRVRLHRARVRLREHLAPALPPRKEIEPMIEVEVQDVITKVLPEANGVPRLVNDRLRIVLRRERGGDRVLPIWIGPEEGDALALQLAGEGLPRPLTADLMAHIVEATGARVDGVVIASLRERTFYGVVRLETGEGTQEIDARPSDAINLAARAGAPIFVDAAILDEAGRPAGELPACLDEEDYTVIGTAAEGEWHSVSPQLALALREPPKPAP